MVTFEAKINNLRAQNFVQHGIDMWSFINYQPIENLDNTQISAMADSLEAFLQTEIGTPHGYTITVKLTNIQSGTEVDESEVALRFISDIGFEVTVTVT